MRPPKHVTHSQTFAQEVFDLSIARHFSEKDGVPVATTSESDAITLFGWATNKGVWQDVRISHAPIQVVRGAPEITNRWNWSRRVGLASFGNLIYVVYKRAAVVDKDAEQPAARLMVDTFSLEESGRFELVASFPVHMPYYRVPGPPDQLLLRDKEPGFELWTGIDEPREKLLIVTQTLRDERDGDPETKLTLMQCDLNRLDERTAWQYEDLDDGGFGLDIRHNDNTLTLAYRTTAAALTLPLVGIDSFLPTFELEINARPDFDELFAPVRILTVNLPDLDAVTLQVPGGEHPRIQNLAPLILTVDRPILRVLLGAGNASGAPINWQTRGADKLTFVFDAPREHLARGVLLPIHEGNRPTFPRTAAPWVNTQDLFSIKPVVGLTWASVWPKYPLEPLAVTPTEKGFLFDFLHKTPLFALQKSRAELSPNFENKKLEISDLKTEVYDINHLQIRRPDFLSPDTAAENEHFAPFGNLPQQSDGPILTTAYFSDNTIGGSLVNDRDRKPYQFVAYTDLGDGGLRIVFDGNFPPPHEPCPADKDKLDPASVPGPGSGDEQWIELVAKEWQDAMVPAIMLKDLFVHPTLTSTNHDRMESFVLAGLASGLGDLDDSGWSESQVNGIQTQINDVQRIFTPPDVRSDTATPPTFISILTPEAMARADMIFDAGIQGLSIASVDWTFSGPGSSSSTVMTQTGRPVTIVFPEDGAWTVAANITATDGTMRTFSIVIRVADSLFRTLSSMHRSLADRGLEPPLNSIGNFHIGSGTFDLLQYSLQFPVDADLSHAHHIVIDTLPQTMAEWRFEPNLTEQGLVNYRLKITFKTDDVRLEGILAAVLTINRIEASFLYGRRFTPAILMNDTRSRHPLTRRTMSRDGLSEFPGLTVPRLASTITCRPTGDAEITVPRDLIKVNISMLNGAASAAVLTLLLGLGAIGLWVALTVAVSGLAVATASLAVGGPAAVTAVIVAAALVAFIVAAFVPPVVAAAIAENIRTSLSSGEMLAKLEDANFIEFAGEGIGESIARQAIVGANAMGASLVPPTPNPEEIGTDRFRQDVFQMIHVSEGKCRVLVRT